MFVFVLFSFHLSPFIFQVQSVLHYFSCLMYLSSYPDFLLPSLCVHPCLLRTSRSIFFCPPYIFSFSQIYFSILPLNYLYVLLLLLFSNLHISSPVISSPSRSQACCTHPDSVRTPPHPFPTFTDQTHLFSGNNQNSHS